MPNCSVLCCRSRSDIFNLHRGGVSYHRFPTDPAVKSKWIEATGRKNWAPVKKSTICSKHFLEWDYLKEVLRPKILKKGTVPSQRLFYTDDGSIFIDRMVHPETMEEMEEAAACGRCGVRLARCSAVFACLQCGVTLCAACDDAQHARHCVVRVPSRLVYNQLKELWEPLQNEVNDRLQGPAPEYYEDPAADSGRRKRRAASSNKADPASLAPTKQKPPAAPPEVTDPADLATDRSPKSETKHKIVNPFALLRDKAVRRKIASSHEGESRTEGDVDHVKNVESEEIEVLMDVACFGDLEGDAIEDIEEEPPDPESEVDDPEDT